MVSISNVKESITALIGLIMSLIVFELVIQPILVSIDPMFADNIISLPSRATPTTPAELAWLATAAAFLIVPMIFKLTLFADSN